MESTNKTVITVKTTVNAPVEKVWSTWNTPEDIMQWCSASDDWHTTASTNDLRPGGAFSSRMEAKDGSMGFDFGGVYDEVILHRKISYTMADGRRVEVLFSSEGSSTEIVESFDAETENPVEMQRDGWQAILNHFKAHTESKQG